MSRGTTVFFVLLTIGVIVWFANSALEGKFSKKTTTVGTNQQTNTNVIVKAHNLGITFKK